MYINTKPISEDTSSILITGRTFRISKGGGGGTTKEVQKFKEGCKTGILLTLHVNFFIYLQGVFKSVITVLIELK